MLESFMSHTWKVTEHLVSYTKSYAWVEPNSNSPSKSFDSNVVLHIRSEH